IGDFTLGEDDISLIDGLTVTSVVSVDTGDPDGESYDPAVDSTLVTFSDGGEVYLSDILLTEQDLFG
ncbi:hypothetical protein, partial [Congregibacter sp.]|uniref:hypothetical protein n=1 Tax=Congregibacter sp. TaxID=2744308 RepID=UPI0039E37CA6